jgi:hypothetical protein
VYADVEVSYTSPSLIVPIGYKRYLESRVFNDLNDYTAA